MMAQTEEWMPVENCENYSVSSLGRVYNTKMSRMLRPREISVGYYIVDLKEDTKFKSYYIHKLVAQAFIPKTDEELTHVIHLNFDKKDNRATNLQWVTKGDARAYAHEHLTKITSIKETLGPRDIELGASNVSKRLMPSMWYKWQGKYYKVRDFKSGLFIFDKSPDGSWKHVNIAQDILNKVVGPAPSENHVVGYKDFDRFNLSPYNLVWETFSEKKERYYKFSPIYKLKVAKKGKDIQKNKVFINERKKKNILKMRENGKSIAKIAKLNNLTPSTLNKYMKKWEQEGTTPQQYQT